MFVIDAIKKYKKCPICKKQNNFYISIIVNSSNFCGPIKYKFYNRSKKRIIFKKFYDSENYGKNQIDQISNDILEIDKNNNFIYNPIKNAYTEEYIFASICTKNVPDNITTTYNVCHFYLKFYTMWDFCANKIGDITEDKLSIRSFYKNNVVNGCPGKAFHIGYEFYNEKIHIADEIISYDKRNYNMKEKAFEKMYLNISNTANHSTIKDKLKIFDLLG